MSMTPIARDILLETLRRDPSGYEEKDQLAEDGEGENRA